MLKNPCWILLTVIGNMLGIGVKYVPSLIKMHGIFISAAIFFFSVTVGSMMMYAYSAPFFASPVERRLRDTESATRKPKRQMTKRDGWGFILPLSTSAIALAIVAWKDIGASVSYFLSFGEGEVNMNNDTDQVLPIFPVLVALLLALCLLRKHVKFAIASVTAVATFSLLILLAYIGYLLGTKGAVKFALFNTFLVPNEMQTLWNVFFDISLSLSLFRWSGVGVDVFSFLPEGSGADEFVVLFASNLAIGLLTYCTGFLSAFITYSEIDLAKINLTSGPFDAMFYGIELFKTRIFTGLFILLRILQSIAFFSAAYLNICDLIEHAKTPKIVGMFCCGIMIVVGPLLSQLYNGYNLDPLLILVPSGAMLIAVQCLYSAIHYLRGRYTCSSFNIIFYSIFLPTMTLLLTMIVLFTFLFINSPSLFGHAGLSEYYFFGVTGNETTQATLQFS